MLLEAIYGPSQLTVFKFVRQGMHNIQRAMEQKDVTLQRKITSKRMRRKRETSSARWMSVLQGS